MIREALIEEKGKWLDVLEKAKYEWEGEQIIEALKQYEPQMGYHKLPTTLYEVQESIKLRIERDNFYERHTTSGNH